MYLFIYLFIFIFFTQGKEKLQKKNFVFIR